ncbi:hypothetical protein F5882DRAFT_397115 [Hyaloscypha sp. PMI_1271]|nr:hypothetical protein F5882DRAFT_397115 [Hyaloscypha sp. PMI_1271]
MIQTARVLLRPRLLAIRRIARTSLKCQKQRKQRKRARAQKPKHQILARKALHPHQASLAPSSLPPKWLLLLPLERLQQQSSNQKITTRSQSRKSQLVASQLRSRMTRTVLRLPRTMTLRTRSKTQSPLMKVRNRKLKSLRNPPKALSSRTWQRRSLFQKQMLVKTPLLKRIARNQHHPQARRSKSLRMSGLSPLKQSSPNQSRLRVSH